MEKVILARYRASGYTVNFNNGRYYWAGCKDNKFDKKTIPYEVYNYLQMNTNCFKNGELVIVEDNQDHQELIDEIIEKEEYFANTHTRDEIVKILEGTIKKMKDELSNITNESEKMFVMQIAKEIKLDSVNKLKFLREWVGTSYSTDEILE